MSTPIELLRKAVEKQKKVNKKLKISVVTEEDLVRQAILELDERLSTVEQAVQHLERGGRFGIE